MCCFTSSHLIASRPCRRASDINNKFHTDARDTSKTHDKYRDEAVARYDVFNHKFQAYFNANGIPEVRCVVVGCACAYGNNITTGFTGQ
jgi:hypothetical protein